mmetsp:Transcript_4368/g.9477  ORF Transcript_4368/g.9477 Transcript_4368/m.9477 type:complete len:89 (-) Transcript_4368:175-441(-)
MPPFAADSDHAAPLHASKRSDAPAIVRHFVRHHVTQQQPSFRIPSDFHQTTIRHHVTPQQPSFRIHSALHPPSFIRYQQSTKLRFDSS